MTFVHFKLAHNGRTYRFAPAGSNDQLFQGIKNQVEKIVKKDAFKLYWNDDESDVLLESTDDLLTAIDYAKAIGASTSQPPCVRLTVSMSQTMESQTSEQKAEEAAECIPADPKPLHDFVYSAAEMRRIWAVEQLEQATDDILHPDVLRSANDVDDVPAVTDTTDNEAVAKGPTPLQEISFSADEMRNIRANLQQHEQMKVALAAARIVQQQRVLSYWCSLMLNGRSAQVQAQQQQAEASISVCSATASALTDLPRDTKPQRELSYSRTELLNIRAALTREQAKPTVAIPSAITAASTKLPKDPKSKQELSYSSTEMRSIRTALKQEQAKAVASAVASTTSAVSIDFSKDSKPLRERSYSSTEMRIIRDDMRSKDGIRWADLRKLTKFNVEVEKGEKLRLVVSSFKVDHNIKTSESTLVFRFDSPTNFSRWEEGLQVALTAAGASDSLITSSRKNQLTVTVSPVVLDWLLFWLKSLASKTEFNHVQIDGTPMTIRLFSEFFGNSRVCQLTIQQKRDDVDQFTPWFEFVRNVRPVKVRVNRREVTQELVTFLMEAAKTVESIWIGGVHAQGAFPLYVMMDMLSGKCCAYLHISDRVTKASEAQVGMLLRYFLGRNRVNKKVSLAIPSDVVPSGIGKYSVKRATGGKFAYEKDTLLIEHVDMDKKAEDMC